MPSMPRHRLALTAAALLAACAGQAPDAAPGRGGREPAAREGRYTLASDRGQLLPTRLPDREGCAIELVSAALTLSGGRFLLATTNRERCPDQAARQESQVAEGDVRLEGDNLRLTADAGAEATSARGVFDGDTLRLTSLHTADGPRDIDWTFAPRR